MDKSFWAILKYLKLVPTRPSTTTIVAFLVGCLLLFIAVELALRQIRREEEEHEGKKKGIK